MLLAVVVVLLFAIVVGHHCMLLATVVVLLLSIVIGHHCPRGVVIALLWTIVWISLVTILVVVLRVVPLRGTVVPTTSRSVSTAHLLLEGDVVRHMLFEFIQS